MSSKFSEDSKSELIRHWSIGLLQNWTYFALCHFLFDLELFDIEPRWEVVELCHAEMTAWALVLSWSLSTRLGIFFFS